jgi:hypothetical protein
VALVVLASARLIATYTVFNHTYDEPGHIACGLEWLQKGTYRYETQHPPLGRVVAALLPYLAGARTHNTPIRDVTELAKEGNSILYEGHHYDLRLALARLGILPFFWVACLVVYQWGKRYSGSAVAVTAVFLFSFLPPVLAHTGLATNDMALTAFLGAAFLAGMIWLEQPTSRLALLFGVTTALAVLAKFTTLAFLPASVAAALAVYILTERPKVARLAAEARRRLPSFGLAVLVASVVIWGGYRFSFGTAASGGIPLPAPELFSGIQEMMLHSAVGHPSYLLGKRSHTGFWYFYEVALAVKTPIAYLILLVAGVLLALRKQTQFRRPWVGLAFAAGILAVGLFSRVNIGIRHVLPVYIGFSLVAAAAAVTWLEAPPAGPGGKWILPALAVLMAWFAVSSLACHPDYLAYFNETAGSQPEKILVDSDLDWGQDTKRLARRLREAGATEATYAAFLIADLEGQHGFPHLHKRLNVLTPPPGWVAVSVSLLKQRRLNMEDSHPEITLWPDRLRPMERVGKSILLYHFAEPRR